MKLNSLVTTYPLVLCVVVLTSACEKKVEWKSTVVTNDTANTQALTPVPQVADVTELKIEDTKVGTGAVAEPGKRVTVHYTGWLTNGTRFDSSKDRGQPFTFPLGEGRVIKGWDQGVAGMKVGGMRKLTIPPSLGYGANGTGGVIPPNATLVFEVELLGVN